MKLLFKESVTDNMNSMINTGFYIVQTVTYAPLTNYAHWYAVMVCDFNNNYTTQVAIVLDTLGLYLRNRINGTWGSWIEK